MPVHFALLVISAIILDAQATWKDNAAWAGRDKPDEWNREDKPDEWNREDKPDEWNQPDLESIAERVAEWENSPERDSIAERLSEWNKTVWNKPGWETSPEWEIIKAMMAEWNTTVWNKSIWEESIVERIADWNKTMWNNSEWNNTMWNNRDRRDGRGRGRGRGVFQEEPNEEPDSVSGAMALNVSNASAFVADPKAEHVVRTALAELAAIEEESIIALSLTLAAEDHSRRLTAVPMEGIVNVRYVISGANEREEFSRIISTLRNISSTEVTRVFGERVQAAGLAYVVKRANVTSVAFAPAEPCAESQGRLRGSHCRGNCTEHHGNCTEHHGNCTEHQAGPKLALLIGIFVGVSATFLALCLGVTACAYRRLTKPTEPNVIVVTEGAPCASKSAKATPKPAQGAVVDDNNNNNNNNIVMGYVVP